MENVFDIILTYCSRNGT